MKGNNSITMNKATMLEAMNLWLESEFKEPPIATNVTEDGSTYSFTITLGEQTVLTEKETMERNNMK